MDYGASKINTIEIANWVEQKLSKEHERYGVDKGHHLLWMEYLNLQIGRDLIELSMVESLATVDREWRKQLELRKDWDPRKSNRARDNPGQVLIDFEKLPGETHRKAWRYLKKHPEAAELPPSRIRASLWKVPKEESYIVAVVREEFLQSRDYQKWKREASKEEGKQQDDYSEGIGDADR